MNSAHRALLWVLLCACQSAPAVRDVAPPSLPTETLEVLGQTLTDCTVKYVGTVQSPERDLTLHQAMVEFVVDGKVLNSTEQALSVLVPAGTTHELSFEKTFACVKDADALTAPDASGPMLVALRGVLNGSVNTPAGPFEVHLPFARSKELRRPRLPKVKLVDFEAGRFSEREVQVLFHLGVVNPNPFELLLTGLRYQAMLAGKPVSEGFIGKGERISAASTGVFDVTAVLNEQTYGPEVKQVIKSLVVPYVLTGEATTALTRTPLDARGEIRLRSTNE